MAITYFSFKKDDPFTEQDWYCFIPNVSVLLSLVHSKRKILFEKEICYDNRLKLAEFGEHEFLKQTQAAALRKDKELLKKGQLLLHFDFAENYAVHYATEPMEFHWTHMPGVVLFTAVAYYRDAESKLITESIGVVCEADTNGTMEMACCLNRILIDLHDRGIQFPHGVKLWSDGATKHFKNRYAMAFLSHFPDMYGADGEWNFCESYHGKGPMDCVGALLKHTVYKEVLRGQAFVQNTMDFYLAAKQLVPGVYVLLLTKAELEENRVQYERIWTDASDAHGILRARRFVATSRYNLAFYGTSISQEPMFSRDITPKNKVITAVDNTTIIAVDHANEQTIDNSAIADNDNNDHINANSNTLVNRDHITVGTYLLAKLVYQSKVKHYVALVTGIDDNMYDVLYLRKTADGCFTSPEEQDRDAILIERIEQVLPPPQLTRRNSYLFEGVDFPLLSIC